MSDEKLIEAIKIMKESLEFYANLDLGIKITGGFLGKEDTLYETTFENTARQALEKVKELGL